MYHFAPVIGVKRHSVCSQQAKVYISLCSSIKIKYNEKQINKQRVLYLINDTQYLKVRVLKELKIHSREFLLETIFEIEFCFL